MSASQPYIGEIYLYGFNFAPAYPQAMLCGGQLLNIAENAALYALIGTTYGGDGVQTFAIPDLRGRTPVGQGGNYPIGMLSGTESVSLTSTQMPAHSHPLVANGTGTESTPIRNFMGAAPGLNQYSNGATGVMNPQSVSLSGNSMPHDNMQPYLVLNYSIIIEGIFPPRD